MRKMRGNQIAPFVPDDQYVPSYRPKTTTAKPPPNKYGRYTCYECEDDECLVEEKYVPRCKNAFSCYKGMGKNNGTTSITRSCVESLQQERFLCGKKSKEGEYPSHNFQCCKGDLCNGGSFPAITEVIIPSIPHFDDTSIQLGQALTIVLSIALTIVILIAIFQMGLLRNLRWLWCNPNEAARAADQERSMEDLNNPRPNRPEPAVPKVVYQVNEGRVYQNIPGTSDDRLQERAENSLDDYQNIPGTSGDRQQEKDSDSSDDSKSMVDGRSLAESKSSLDSCYDSKRTMDLMKDICPVASCKAKNRLGIKLTHEESNMLKFDLIIYLRISMTEKLDCGSFGTSKEGIELYKAKWRKPDDTEMTVMVKTYYQKRYQEVWDREVDFCHYHLPRGHDNFLPAYGSDVVVWYHPRDLLLVTAYPNRGTLRNYLRSVDKVHYQTALKMCYGVLNGLTFMHTHQMRFAHLNITSASVYMFNEGHCVIGDFGYTVHAGTACNLKYGNYILGLVPPRYMSPEMLNKDTFPKKIKNFLRADVYSVGLVMWEIFGKIFKPALGKVHELPYDEYIDKDNLYQEPNIDEMRTMIVVDSKRPSVPPFDDYDEPLVTVANLIQSCWFRPKIRPTMDEVTTKVWNFMNGVY